MFFCRRLLVIILLALYKLYHQQSCVSDGKAPHMLGIKFNTYYVKSNSHKYPR